MKTIVRIGDFITKFFTLWLVLLAIIAFLNPEPFKPAGKYVTYLLGIIMLSMGLTMKLNDFKLVLSRPKDVLYGVALRYMIMPFVGFSVAKLFGLPPALAAGLILVGCCPSGTSSNVMTFIAKGDTALSVTVSSINTVIAPIATPFLFMALAGALVPINAQAMLLDILVVVIIPVAIGISLNTFMPNYVVNIQKILPMISVIAILIINTAVVALSASKLATVALIIFAAVAMHNLTGFTLGYWMPRLLGMPPKKARAISFEIGMENAGLAVALAMAHLEPLAAIPAAVFSMWHLTSGSTLANMWSRKVGTVKDGTEDIQTGDKAL
ncbi:Pantothenate precursors transporter PanS [Sporomusa rhizae]|uniref:bile acid:sodium symporter family protein n=1 Tax=Sporomusa rhizae TaxID=357999 RepID=UPI00352ADD9F